MSRTIVRCIVLQRVEIWYTVSTMRYITGLLITLLALAPSALFAQLTGGNYEIYGDSFSFVSGNGSTGGIYDLYDTGGEFFAASSAGGDYTLRGGYRAVEKGILRVDVSETSLTYGELTPGVVASSSIDITVWTDSNTGYGLYIRENHAPTTTADVALDDVTDGDVDGSAEEYGISATGADVVIGAGDIAVSSTSQLIAESTGGVQQRTTTLVYKVAIDGTTADGIYRHTLYPIIVVAP